MVNIEEFKKIQLKVAKILKAERVEGSEKLVRLLIDIAEPEPRQIIAGIGKKYAPEDLEKREIVVVVNLEPRELMGNKSYGMLLAATDSEGNPVIILPEKEVPVGSEVK